MIEYYNLNRPFSEALIASDTVENPYEVSLCPITAGTSRHRTIKRKQDLALQVRHSKHDELMIWTQMGEVVVHERLLTDFGNSGVSGYRLRPAMVSFRDGQATKEYSELIVTGWAGTAPPESGIRLLEACPGCGTKKYSGADRYDKLIDWDQWSGEDLFIVWPLPKFILVSGRGAEVLQSLHVKSYSLTSMRRPSSGYSVGPLSNYMPDDIATKYGRLTGL